MRKFITTITLTFILLSLTVFTGYALFKFPGIFSPVVQGDPIKENWDPVSSSYNRSDKFEVYFFPQGRYADLGKPHDIYQNPTLLDNIKKEDILNYYNTASTKSESYNFFLESINLNSTLGTGLKYDGYWSEFDTYNLDRYKYKIETVESNISNECFKKVGEPVTEKKQLYGDSMYDGEAQYEVLRFAGWTYDQRVAALKGYTGSGDFKLVDSKTSLDMIDRIDYTGKQELRDDKVLLNRDKKLKGIDGSYVGDGIVFLYPIFTCGKDYFVGYGSDTRPYVPEFKPQNSVNLKIQEGNSFQNVKKTFSTLEYDQLSSPSDNFESFGTLFKYSGLNVTQSMINNNYNVKLNIEPRRLRPKQYEEFPYKEGYDWYEDFFENRTDVYFKNNGCLNYYPQDIYYGDLNLIKRPGNYNIYVYTVDLNFDYSGTMVNFPSQFDYRFIPSLLNGKNITDSFYLDSIDVESLSRQYWHMMKVYVYVEETPEFNFIGGNTHSINSNSLTNKFLYNPHVDKSYSYTLKNVRFNDYDSKYDHTSSGGFMKNGVFGVIPYFRDNRNLAYNIQVGGNAIDKATKGTDFDLPGYTNLNNNMLIAKYDGIFDVNVDCQISGNSVNMTVTLDTHTHDINILIFNSKDDVIKDPKTGFIDYTKCKPTYLSSIEKRRAYKDDPQFGKYVTDIGFCMPNRALSQSDNFYDFTSPVYVENGKQYHSYKSLADILANGKKLYYYNSDREVVINGITRITENTILYLK